MNASNFGNPKERKDKRFPRLRVSIMLITLIIIGDVDPRRILQGKLTEYLIEFESAL